MQVYRQLRPDLEHYIDSDSESDSEEETQSSERPLEILRKSKSFFNKVTLCGEQLPKL